MGFKSFRTNITLDSNYIVGDYGKTAIGIYADDVQLYEKQLTKNDTVLDVNVTLPAGTTYLRIVVSQVEGAKGTHGVVLMNPTLSSSGKDSKTDPTTLIKRIGAYSYEDYDSSDVYQDINGNVTTQAFSLHDYDGGFGYVTFNIDEMGYNVFETKLSLDSTRKQGDYGKTVIGIYADDYLLYEKQLTTKTSVQNIKLNIPKGTKNLKFVTEQIEGARGTAIVVFNNPIIKKTKASLVTVPKMTSVNTVGAIEQYYSYNLQGSNSQYVNGTLPSSGIYFYDSNSYATYDITNMGFNTFKAKLSLDSKKINGDYGKTNIYMYANGKLLYSKALSKSIGIRTLNLRLPSSTKTFKIVVKQQPGAKGSHNVVLGNAVFTKISVSSSLKSSQVTVVNHKTKKDTVIVKSLSKGDVVKIYSSKGKLLATSQKATNGQVTFSIGQLGKSKGTVKVSRTSTGKLESNKISVTYKAEK